MDAPLTVEALRLQSGVLSRRATGTGGGGATVHDGSAIKVVQSFTVCHFDRTWASQPKLDRLYVGNVDTSAAKLFSGNQFAKVARLFNFMHVPFISKTTFQTYQNNLLFRHH